MRKLEIDSESSYSHFTMTTTSSHNQNYSSLDLLPNLRESTSCTFSPGRSTCPTTPTHDNYGFIPGRSSEGCYDDMELDETFEKTVSDTPIYGWIPGDRRPRTQSLHVLPDSTSPKRHSYGGESSPTLRARLSSKFRRSSHSNRQSSWSEITQIFFGQRVKPE